MQPYTDHELGLAHGDALADPLTGSFAFRFRCGPAPRWGGRYYSRGHQGKVKRAWGQDRYRRTSQALRMAEAHSMDGFRIRRGLRALKEICPKWADDLPPRHAEKNWKRHRKTQWEPR